MDFPRPPEILVTLIFEGATRAMSAPDPDMAHRWMESGMALMFDGIAADTSAPLSTTDRR